MIMTTKQLGTELYKEFPKGFPDTYEAGYETYANVC